MKPCFDDMPACFEIHYRDSGLKERLHAALVCLFGGTFHYGLSAKVIEELKRRLPPEHQAESHQKSFDEYFKSHIESTCDCDIFNHYSLDWGNLNHMYHHAYKCGEDSQNKK